MKNDKIINARKNAELSQKNLGELLGVTLLTVHNWEVGKITLKPYQMVGILAMIKTYQDEINNLDINDAA